MYWKRPSTKKKPNAHEQANNVPDLSFYDSNKTQGRTMGLTHLLNVDLHNDNLKVRKLVRETARKVFTDEERLSLCHNDIVLKKENKSYRNVQGHGD